MFPYRRISINLPSLIQENAADLNSVCKAPTLVMTGEKHIDPVTNTSLYHCMIYPLVAIC